MLVSGVMQAEAAFREELAVWRVTGTFVLEDSIDIFGQALDRTLEHGLTRMLIDALDLGGGISELQRYFYGEAIAAQIMQRAVRHPGRVPKVAYVLGPAFFDERRFGETVAVNRGAHLRVFGERAEAEAWLLA